MKNSYILSALLFCGALASACSDDDTNAVAPGYDPTYGTGDAPEVVSIEPADGATGLDTINHVVVTYNMDIYTPEYHSVKINDTYYADSVKVENKNQLVIYFRTSGNTRYDVEIKSPTVRNATYAFAKASKFSFKTRIYNNFDPTQFNLDPELCNPDATEPAKKLYQYLLSQFGKVTLSAAMANHNGWSTDEAEFMHGITGKYPAINTVDFMHLRWSKPLGNANWVDLSNTKILEDWVAENGIVAAGWHWNVPKTEADKGNLNNYAFYTDGNTVTARQAVRTTRWENKQINEDIDALSTILLSLQDKGIALLWRPLHEASGGWFWWGTSGAAQYRKLWIYLYDRLKANGVNNLIWVWTCQGNDADWYPGDQYVDIIGRDNYDNKDHSSIKAEFDALAEISGHKKMVTLSECGSIPNIYSMLDGGDMWSYCMPWNSEYTESETWQSADFYNEFMLSDYVITRDELPSLK